MSARQKIAALQATIDAAVLKIAELQPAADKEIDTSSLAAGDTVSFEYGRAEKKRNLSGVVIAIKREPNKAALVKVQVGDGFDAEILTVFETTIFQVGGAAAVDPLAGVAVE